MGCPEKLVKGIKWFRPNFFKLVIVGISWTYFHAAAKFLNNPASNNLKQHLITRNQSLSHRHVHSPFN